MRTLRSQSGQMVVEAVLLITLGLGISLTVIKTLKKNEFAQNLINKPWSMLTGMIECGTWKPCGPGMHPSTRSRNVSLNPGDS